MPIPQQQAKQIKQQLLQQIEQQPIENKEQIKQQILAFNEEQLEQFLKQNNIQTDGSSDNSPNNNQTPPCIFCSITKGETPSYKIAENKKSIAVLEVNPVSKGHSIILPLEHSSTEKIPKSAMTLAQKIAKKIKTKLKPEDIKIETSSIQGHSMINIIPIYKDSKFEKKQASEKELKQLQSKLETKKRSQRKIKKPLTKIEEISKLPKISFRIP